MLYNLLKYLGEPGGTRTHDPEIKSSKRAVVDGTLLPRQPFDPDAPAVSADIPLIVGDTTHAASLFLACDDKVWHGTLTEAELRARVGAMVGAEADRAVET